MDKNEAIRGVRLPVVAPFTDSMEPDAERLEAHCRWLIDNKERAAPVYNVYAISTTESVAQQALLPKET